MKLAVLTNAVATANPRTIECSVSDIALKSIDFNSINLTGDKAVFVDFVYPDDTKERLWCSKSVSAGLRDKSITLANFGTLVVAKATTADGTSTFWQLQMPNGESNAFSVDASKIGTKPIERKKVSWNDIIALGDE